MIAKDLKEHVRLTNGQETFMLSRIICDELGPAHGIDSRGIGYTRRLSTLVWESDEDSTEYSGVK